MIVLYSHKEVEELTVQKKGWQKSYVGINSSSLLAGDVKNTTESLLIKSSSEQLPKTFPKSLMEFGRDWRRIMIWTNRLIYLKYVGSTKFKKLLVNADDFELLEDIITHIIRLHFEPSDEIELNSYKWIQLFITMSQYSILFNCLPISIQENIDIIIKLPIEEIQKEDKNKYNNVFQLYDVIDDIPIINTENVVNLDSDEVIEEVGNEENDIDTVEETEVKTTNNNNNNKVKSEFEMLDELD